MCGENEQIASVTAADEDILSVDGDTVTALGEYFSTVVTVTTMEKEVPLPAPRYENIVVFGSDLAPALCGMRAYLRDLIGVERVAPPRTELRILNTYTYAFKVEGFNETPAEKTIELLPDYEAVLAFPLTENERVLFFRSGDDEVATAARLVLETDGLPPASYYVLTGVGEGKTRTVVSIGFFKTVDEETYAQYLKSLPPDAEQPFDVEEASREAGGPVIPVITRCVQYSVTAESPASGSSRRAAALGLKPTGTAANAVKAGETPAISGGTAARAPGSIATASGIVSETNAQRRANGLPALVYDAALQAAANTRAGELAALFSHTRPNGGAPVSAAPELYAHASFGENIASISGNTDAGAKTFLTMWMNSPGHRANILRSEYFAMAAGVYYDEARGVVYAVQLFTGATSDDALDQWHSDITEEQEKKQEESNAEKKEEGAANNYTYKVFVVAPTCTDRGYTLHQCNEDITKTYSDNYVPAIGGAHQYEVTHSESRDSGSYHIVNESLKCSVCGHQTSRETWTDIEPAPQPPEE